MPTAILESHTIEIIIAELGKMEVLFFQNFGNTCLEEAGCTVRWRVSVRRIRPRQVTDGDGMPRMAVAQAAPAPKSAAFHLKTNANKQMNKGVPTARDIENCSSHKKVP